MKATHKQTLLYFGIFVAAIVSWGLLGDWSFALNNKRDLSTGTDRGLAENWEAYDKRLAMGPARIPTVTWVPATTMDHAPQSRDASLPRHTWVKRRRGGSSSSSSSGGSSVNWTIGLAKYITFGFDCAVVVYIIIFFIVRAVKPSAGFLSARTDIAILGLLGLVGAFAVINQTALTAIDYNEFPDSDYSRRFKAHNVVSMVFNYIAVILMIATLIWECLYMRKHNARNLRESIMTAERRKLSTGPLPPPSLSPSSLPHKLESGTPTPQIAGTHFVPVTPGSQPPPGATYYYAVPAGDHGSVWQPGSGHQLQPQAQSQLQYQYQYQLHPGEGTIQQPTYVVHPNPGPLGHPQQQ